MKQEIEICVCVRWNHKSADVILRETERLLDSFAGVKLLSSAPLHWNIPCWPYLESALKTTGLITETIKERIKIRGDMIIPAGYAGANASLLGELELEKEISWSRSNPWHSGISDFFGACGETMIPLLPDISRPDFLTAYKKCGFSKIGLEHGVELHTLSELRNESGAGIFTYIIARPKTIAELASIFKKNPGSIPVSLILMIDFEGFEEVAGAPHAPNAIVGLIDLLSAKRTVRIVRIDSMRSFLPGIDSFPLTRHAGASCANTPAARRMYMELGKSRQHKSDDTIRETLIAASHLSAKHEKEKPSAKKIRFPGKDRVTIADMRGNAILSGNGFDVNFSEGRLSGLSTKKAALLAGVSSGSFISAGGTEHQFQTVNSSSIESERVRGLRVLQNIVIPGEEDKGSQVTDYIFVEDFPYLLVTTLIRYPHICLQETIENVAPIEIPLFIINKNEGTIDSRPKAKVAKDAVSIDAFSHGKKSAFMVYTSERQAILSADYFSFTKNEISLVFGFVEHGGLHSGTIELRVSRYQEKQSKKALLSINPLGTYERSPASCISGKTELISFFLGLADCKFEKPLSFPQAVLNEIP